MLPPSIKVGIPEARTKSAPGSFADERTDVQLFEKPGHRVAARTGEFVDEHRFRSVNRARRNVPIFAVAESDFGELLAIQIFDDVIGEQTAAVKALVNNRALFIGLREEITIKLA
jgi:hypothetical protein